MSTRSIFSLILAALVLPGCGSEDPGGSANRTRPVAQNDAEQVPAPASTDAERDGFDAEPVAVDEQSSPADAEAAAMAEQLGMTVAELQMKKQMMMDAGITPQEIAKALTMGGDPSRLFKDDALSNTAPPASIKDLIFFRNDKETQVKLADYIGKFNLVLVFTRGYSGGTICPFCAIQTAQLAANYQKFLDRDARVMIVYPGAEEHLQDFAAAVSNVDREQADIAAVKWPVVLDPNLKAVELLDIVADLAQPSTFIIDKQGNVVFSYVGANRSDRPSVAAMLKQLDGI